MFERILVPMDGSRLCLTALSYAAEIAKRFNAEVVLLRVVTESIMDIASTAPVSGGPAIKQDFLKEARQRDRRKMTLIRQYLRKKLRSLTAQGISGSFRVMTGSPASSIIECCGELSIDLVVIAGHGKGFLKRAIMGSVIDELISNSRVPLLVIRKQRNRK
jgi:nucleotide-binding universal stress UspA family protein